jgi:hypothetical protein
LTGSKLVKKPNLTIRSPSTHCSEITAKHAD